MTSLLNVGDRMFRRLVQSRLGRLRNGYLLLFDDAGMHAYGDPASALRATIRVKHPRFFRRLATGGGIGAADALIDGDWVCDSLTSLVRIFIRNFDVADPADTGWSRIRSWIGRAAHRLRRNSVKQAKRNIQAHYDLSNDFYRQFLDSTMAYSCGVYEAADTTLHEASLAKFERLCRKLDLRQEDHLLEIGTGWGGLAIHAAHMYGCRVTTTTISQQQYDEAVRLVAAAGVQDRVDVLLQDYRHLRGKYDKIVSVEMIEAVGFEYLDTFFRKCNDLLHPEGMMALQAIVMSDQRYREYLGSVDFIRTHVFPGGCLPCNSELLNSITRATDMRLLHLEDFAPHYARTLRDWRSNFEENRATIEQLGFDAKFQRLWEYYLCYCEAAFEERHVNLVQMLLAKKECRFDPLTINVPTADCEGSDKSVQSPRFTTARRDAARRSVTAVASAATATHQPQGTEL